MAKFVNMPTIKQYVDVGRLDAHPSFANNSFNKTLVADTTATAVQRTFDASFKGPTLTADQSALMNHQQHLDGPNAPVKQTMQRASFAKLTPTTNRTSGGNSFLFNSYAHAGHTDVPIGLAPQKNEGRFGDMDNPDLTKIPALHHPNVAFATRMERALQEGKMGYGQAVNVLLDRFDQTAVANEGAIAIPEVAFDHYDPSMHRHNTDALEAGSWRDKNIRLAPDLDERMRRLYEKELDYLAQTESGATLLRHVYAMPIPIELRGATQVESAQSTYNHPVKINSDGELQSSTAGGVQWVGIIRGPRKPSDPSVIFGRDGAPHQVRYAHVLGHELVHFVVGFKAFALDMEAHQRQNAEQITWNQLNDALQSTLILNESTATHWQHIFATEIDSPKPYWAYTYRHDELTFPSFWAALQQNTLGKHYLVIDKQKGGFRPLQDGEVPVALEDEFTLSTRANPPPNVRHTIPTAQQLEHSFYTGVPLPSHIPKAFHIDKPLTEANYQQLHESSLRYGVTDHPIVLRYVREGLFLNSEGVVTLPGGAQWRMDVAGNSDLLNLFVRSMPVVIERLDGTQVPLDREQQRQLAQEGGVKAFFDNDLFMSPSPQLVPIPKRKPEQAGGL